MKTERIWVSGWLTQALLLGLAVVALYKGRPDSAVPLIVGSLVIGVMRQHEGERRQRPAPPGSKV